MPYELNSGRPSQNKTGIIWLNKAVCNNTVLKISYTTVDHKYGQIQEQLLWRTVV